MMSSTHRPNTSRRPRCCRTCLKPMQGHPTGRNNPCRAITPALHQPSPTRPWPRTNQAIGRMMESLCSRDSEANEDADNEEDEFDISYECPSASSSSSDESAASTSASTLVNKRRAAPCTPPPAKRAGTPFPFPRHQRSVSPEISIDIVSSPTRALNSERSFYVESPFHPIVPERYPVDPIPKEPSFEIPIVGAWSRANPKYHHPAKNAQVEGFLSTSSADLQRAGSARPTEYVPSPERLPAARRSPRRMANGGAAPKAPEVQMLRPPPSHPEKFWGTDCPTERSGTESRVVTPAPRPPSVPITHPAATPKIQYLEMPTGEVRSRHVSVPPEEEDQASKCDADVEERAAMPPVSTAMVVRHPSARDDTQQSSTVAVVRQESSTLTLIGVQNIHIPLTLRRDVLSEWGLWRCFTFASVWIYIPLFLILVASKLAADWVEQNWLN